MRARYEIAGLALAIAVGLALRVFGAQFGLPLWSNLYIRPDESLPVTAAAALFENAGDPGIYVYPALMIDLAAVLYKVYDFLGGEGFARNPSAYFLIARSLSIAAGTATIPLVWWMARRLSGSAGAFAGALLFAVAALPVRDSHFAVTDTLLALFVTGVAAFGVEAFVRPVENRLPALRGMALCFGLAISTKYTAVVLAPLFVGACFFARWPLGRKRAIRSTALLCLWPAVIFALTNPYVVADPRRAAGPVASTLVVMYRDSTPDASWYRPEPLMQIWRPLRHGAGGAFGLLLALAATAAALRRMRAHPGLVFVALTAWAIPASILPFRHPAPYRYLIPAMPAIAVLVAWTLASVGRKAKRPWLAAALGCALAVPSAVQSFALSQRLSRTDTRTLAGRWIERNAAGAAVLFTGGPECEPQVRESRTSLERRIPEIYARFGRRVGDIVSAPYRMMLPHAGEGVDVYRQGGALPPGDRYYVAVPAHPLPMCGSPAEARLPTGSELVYEVRGGGAPGQEYDRIDALFLPMSGIEEVERPGPDIRVLRVTGAAR